MKRDDPADQPMTVERWHELHGRPSGPESLLMSCPACGKQVSRAALACPSCGHRVTGSGLSFARLALAIVGFLLFVFFASLR